MAKYNRNIIFASANLPDGQSKFDVLSSRLQSIHHFGKRLLVFEGKRNSYIKALFMRCKTYEIFIKKEMYLIINDAFVRLNILWQKNNIERLS
ncbi:MAG: hypothetical protein ABR980_04885 [Ignavibacteriaceae bacterium]|jgi:hypothetical protein